MIMVSFFFNFTNIFYIFILNIFSCFNPFSLFYLIYKYNNNNFLETPFLLFDFKFFKVIRKFSSELELKEFLFTILKQKFLLLKEKEFYIEFIEKELLKNLKNPHDFIAFNFDLVLNNKTKTDFLIFDFKNINHLEQIIKELSLNQQIIKKELLNLSSISSINVSKDQNTISSLSFHFPDYFFLGFSIFIGYFSYRFLFGNICEYFYKINEIQNLNINSISSNNNSIIDLEISDLKQTYFNNLIIA